MSERSGSLERWSVTHAALMLGTFAFGALRGDLRPLAAVAALSFAWLLVRERNVFTLRRLGPSAVTALRAALVCAVPFVLADEPGALLGYASALVLVLDGVDGALARRLDACTDVGAHFDMETDACFVLMVEAELWQRGVTSGFIVATGLLRYVYVLWSALARPSVPAEPRSRLARAAFFVLAAGLVAIPFAPAQAAPVIAVCASLPVFGSFARSFIWLYRPGARS